jgi:hypothetical protein
MQTPLGSFAWTIAAAGKRLANLCLCIRRYPGHGHWPVSSELCCSCTLRELRCVSINMQCTHNKRQCQSTACLHDTIRHGTTRYNMVQRHIMAQQIMNYATAHCCRREMKTNRENILTLGQSRTAGLLSGRTNKPSATHFQPLSSDQVTFSSKGLNVYCYYCIAAVPEVCPTRFGHLPPYFLQRLFQGQNCRDWGGAVLGVI